VPSLPASSTKPSAFAALSEKLNTNLFDLPRLSPAHDVKREGPFRSAIVRWLWNGWNRTLAPGGRYFFLASGLFFGYGVTSLEFQAFVPLAYAVVVWTFAFATRWLEKPRVKLQAHHPERIAAGETLNVQLQIETSRALGGAIAIAHRLPPEIDLVPEAGAPIPSLKKGEVASISLGIKPQKRGVYQLRGFRVETDFPFGLIQSAQTFESASKLLVYPKFDPIDRLDLPMGRRYQPGGVAFASARGESVEYIGNRDYREGDSVRDIDWRATARLNRPIVREFREEYFLRAAVVLDTHVPKPNPEACADFERAVSLCAAVGDAMNRADYLVDILAAGPDLFQLLAGRGLASLDQMLDILACVESSARSPWATLEPALGANLERITSVVCLFLDWDETRRNFATEMASSGAAVKVVIVRDVEAQGEPTLDPRDSWPGEVPILGAREWAVGVREL
jgi:uncharacterized protein (DUF58 family)